MRRAPLLAFGVLFAAAAACTDAYLYDERRAEDLPVDRAVSLSGSFCTPGANELVRPIKLVLAMDASQSMQVTDPDGTRASALIELLDSLPDDPQVYVSVMLFAGSTTAFLTRSNQPDFDPITSLTPADRTRLVGQLLNFVNPSNEPNRDATDFVKPLSDIYALINRDIANARLGAADGGAEGAAKYSVIFLSDGHPSTDQDDELLFGDAVRRIRQLSDLADDVRLHTVHVFNPVQPVGTNCDLTGDGGCPLLIVNQDAERLQKMAELGGGEFRDFRNNEPINFLGFRFGLSRRTWEHQELLVSNLNAPPGSPIGEADTDGDRLLDAEELDPALGTDPLERDTDGDGFSDGVEVHFASLGARFDPVGRLPDGGGADPGCPPHLRGVDTDCDGLFDCDEQLIGTNSELTDSDHDGVPDAIEWQLRTQPASLDLEQDPDSDGVSSRAEVRLHTRPGEPDVAALTLDGYRYTLRAVGTRDGEGRQCFEYQVDNVLLAPTLADTRDGGTGRGAGLNELYVSLAFLPSDDPGGRTLMRGARVGSARYPVGGIKSPADGRLLVPPELLADGCRGLP